MMTTITIIFWVLWALRFLHRRQWLPFCPFCAVRRDFFAWSMRLYRRETRKHSALGYKMMAFGFRTFTNLFNKSFRDLLKQHRTAQRLLKCNIFVDITGFDPIFQTNVPLRQIPSEYKCDQEGEPK